MSEIFKPAKPKKNPLEELEVVYVLYFDETYGHIPLLIYPDDRYKDDKQFMRPILMHPIWFLSGGESDVLDHIDLEYKGYTFFGKKILVKSQRAKRRAGLDEETPETIVIIVSLSNKLEILGDDIIRLLIEAIKERFEDNLFEIIESEILKDEIIKTPKIKKVIERGENLKKDLRHLIEEVTTSFFSNAVKKADTNSIKMQKAISYLALKGIDVSHIESKDYKGSFSSIQLFDPSIKSETTLLEPQLFTIDDIRIMSDSQEFEILIQNKSEKELKNLLVKITNIKEYFEKEVMNTRVEIWFPEEELVFISPIIPHIKEYLFFIIEEKSNDKLFSKRIDLNLIKELN
ncbi:MAG: hypothetical protein EAX89_17070 [Candidatus Lokiarchaeota archaeon]|nr:hypothetical protein [Candidatus Lokiarchaeota archaeon]